MKLILGDCLEKMEQIEDNSVDLVVSDLPYGVTQNKADTKLDMKIWWTEILRILKSEGKVVLTAQFPFTTELISEATIKFKYDLIWDKRLASGFLNANRMPLRTHEHILVFYNKTGIYTPQFTKGDKIHSRGKMLDYTNRNYGRYKEIYDEEKNKGKKFPNSILRIDKLHPSKAKHPTEKPVELAEWIIKTYSHEGQTVVDTCFGVGWTAVACARLNRNFIGIELNEEYFEIAKKRIENESKQSRLEPEKQETITKVL